MEGPLVSNFLIFVFIILVLIVIVAWVRNGE
jgi:hypothetical protein